MYYSIIGIINSLIWMCYISGALFSKYRGPVIVYITEILHDYFWWYFDLKIAHILSGMAIIYSIILLLKKGTSLGMFVVGFILNFIWMIIYVLSYMN